MGGGLMQLVAYGAQDVYLTGNPQITFFKVVYRRHTNFSTELIKQTFDGQAGPGKTIDLTIARNGDLVNKIYMEVVNPPHSNNGSAQIILPHNLGHAMIDFAELEIGGQVIDKIYGHWMEVWARLTQPNESKNVGVISRSLSGFSTHHPHESIHTKDDGTVVNSHKSDTPSAPVQSVLQSHTHDHVTPGLVDFDMNASSGSMVGMIPTFGGFESVTKFQQMACAGGMCNHSGFNGDKFQGRSGSGTSIPHYFSVPIPFWFCKNAGLALPLIALQYHEVKLKLKFKTDTTGCPDFDTMGTTLSMWADYIYLDTSERRRFAQGSHEYLIEQLQRFDQSVATTSYGGSKTSGEDSKGSAILDLNFNHPVKELIFTSDFDTKNDLEHCGYLPSIFSNHHTTVSLKLNGHDRFSSNRNINYFTRNQIWEHHTGPGNLYDGAEGLKLGHAISGSSTALKGSVLVIDKSASGTYRALGPELRGDQIGVYSFALKPEEHQPSGTCNFSRIDSAKLHLNYLVSTNSQTLNVVVYAINYNVLRIMSGMGGLAYSN